MANEKKVAATEVDVQSVLQEAQKTGNLSEAKFMALLSIMMAKEARIAEREGSLFGSGDTSTYRRTKERVVQLHSRKD